MIWSMIRSIDSADASITNRFCEAWGSSRISNWLLTNEKEVLLNKKNLTDYQFFNFLILSKRFEACNFANSFSLNHVSSEIMLVSGFYSLQCQFIWDFQINHLCKKILVFLSSKKCFFLTNLKKIIFLFKETIIKSRIPSKRTSLYCFFNAEHVNTALGSVLSRSGFFFVINGVHHRGQRIPANLLKTRQTIDGFQPG